MLKRRIVCNCVQSIRSGRKHNDGTIRAAKLRQTNAIMRCGKHSKLPVGSCFWCGTKVCPQCISKQEGKKLYCFKCQTSLGGVRRQPVPKLIKRVSEDGNRLVFQDGYLVLPEGGLDEY